MPPTKEATALMCTESFVGFYDGEGLRQFVGRKDRTVIAADSPEAKLFGKFFAPVNPAVPVIDQTLYPADRPA